MIEPIIFLLYRKTKFITGSQSAKQDLAGIMKIPANNITVIPHGVIIQRPRPFPKKETVKTVIYLGALAKDKGVEDALVAFSLLNRQEEYQFWVVGKPESEAYFERLKGMVKKSGLDRKLKFWGFVSQEKKFDLLARAHLMVNPSVHEGFGLVNIEANAMGTPVVAYRSQGLIDSVKDGVSGIIVDKNSPEALVEVISKLIQSGNYGEYCMGSVRWSKRFNWDKSKEQSLKLIESLGYS
ncbi:MAG: hypothetical protein A2427_04635 [Candidatus Nealsonbacteria bacterium RIFOXYC1_FULL_40_7]|uniref:Glycosyl transferase family 1 domain-containing protein n=1 Tax=Candidatus Nealsonbacteria bacterium RIFOXYC1_FULL_40_7 TaxID=1801678 RepID=A0A1G2ETX4_9BACT|nr:MAG: hypothetical protein A2427_04635 [Candidatus Nealsonbacteria bacterium RIFOXYC1_FULL_40_7]